MPEQAACAACGRRFAATFRKCPFCNAAVVAPPVTGAAAQSSQTAAHDYAALAEQAIAAHRPLLALEFHPAAVAALDAFIDLTWGEEGDAPNDDAWEPSRGKKAAIVGLGAFFGELIRRELGGTWQDDPGQPTNPLMSRVVLRDGQQVFAIGRVFKRLKNGTGDRLEALYSLVRRNCGAQGSPAEVDGWLRQAKHFEGVKRVDLAVSFYDRALALSTDPAQRAAITRQRQVASAQAQADDADARQCVAGNARATLDELSARGRQWLAERGVQTEHGALTLVGLDLLLDETFGRAPAAADRHTESLARELGAFLGSLLCARFRGRWQDPLPSSIEASQVVWAADVAACPFQIVRHRLTQGAQSSVLAQVTPLVNALVARGLAEDPPERAQDWLGQADAYAAHKPPRLDLAVRTGEAALGIAGADTPATRLKLATWSRALKRLDAAAQHLDAAQKQDARNEAVWLERARLELARGAEAAAASAAAQAAELRPESPEAPRLLGEALAAQGRSAAALPAFERAALLDPASADATLGRARALLTQRRAKDARLALDDLLGRSDCEPERSHLAAIAAEQAGDRVAAYALLERVLSHPRLADDLRPQVAERVAELAADPAVRVAAVEKLPDVAQAVAAYAALNEQFPMLAEPWRERGVGLAMLGRTDEALACLHHASALEPREAKSYDHEAVALMRVKRLDEALAALARGLAACPGSGALLTRKGIALAMQGHNEEAHRTFEESLRRDPGHVDAWVYKADVEERLGRNDDAIASLRRFLAEQPRSQSKNAEIARRQLWTLTNPGRTRDPQRAQDLLAEAFRHVQANALAEALPLFDAAVDADPLTGELWLNRGVCLFGLGRFEEARASYAQAEELLGSTTLVAQGLAACLARLQRGDEAVRCFDRVLASLPSSPDALAGKARLLVRLGRAADALGLYQRLVTRSPSDAALARERAEALCAAGQLVEALAAYDAFLSRWPDDVPAAAARSAVAVRCSSAGTRVASGHGHAQTGD